jgi:hypothetical protein
MAEVGPKAPSVRRRRLKSGEAPSPASDGEHVDGVAERPVPEESTLRDDRDGRERSAAAGEGGATGAEGASRVGPGFIARRAAGLVATLTGRRPESVISIDQKEDEWCVGIEVVEVSRIPDSADILAVYDVRIDADGDLISFRRVRRYARGQLDCERQR